MKLGRRGLAIALLWWLHSEAIVSASTSYDLLSLSASPTRTSLVVPDGGIIVLHLCRSGDVPTSPEEVELDLTTFVDPQGRGVPVDLLLPGEPVPPEVRPRVGRLVRVRQPSVAVRLHVGALPSPAGASGHLLLSRGGTMLKTYPITLSAASADRVAKLKLDRSEVTLDVVKPFFGSWFSIQPTFAVAVRDETGGWPLVGLHARLEEARTDLFDPQRHLTFKVADKAAALWTLDDRSPQVSAGGQALLTGSLSDLPPGQHTAKIRLMAANSQLDPGQVLTVKANVKESVWLAIALLLAGMGVSLVLTVALKTRAAVLRLRLRILQAQPSWLAEEPSTIIVTWIRSVFNQAADLRRQFTPAATDILDERVTEASQHLPYLSRIWRLRRTIDASGLDGMPLRRAHKVLQGINARLLPGTLDPATGLSIQREIDQLNGWFTGEQDWVMPYARDLKRDIDTLLRAVNGSRFADSAAALVNTLVTALDSPMPVGARDLVDRERQYAALKLLWERADAPQLVTQLVTRWNAGERIDSLFQHADLEAWRDLNREKETVRFTQPRPRPADPFEPFEPLVFEVQTTRRGLAGTYLFKHNLQFEWTFVRKPPSKGQGLGARIRRRLGREAAPSDPHTVQVVTREPRVATYFPGKGSYECSVRLRFQGAAPIEVSQGTNDHPFTVAIAGSSFGRLMRSIETTEMISLGLAVIVGTASGLLTQYSGNATWGSARDCLALFLWGVGADQASKSFVEVLGRFPRWQSAAQPAASAATVPVAPPSPAAGAPSPASVGTGGPIVPTMAPPV